VVHGFGHDGHASFLTHPDENLQTFLAQSLEGIKRGPGFEGAPSEEIRTGGPDMTCEGQCLRFVFDLAGPGNHGEMAIPDGYRSNLDDGIVGLLRAFKVLLSRCPLESGA
jgi:hypothetical protein